MRKLSNYTKIKVSYQDMVSIEKLGFEKPSKLWKVPEGVLSVDCGSDGKIEIYYNMATLEFAQYLPKLSKKIPCLEFSLSQFGPVFKGDSRGAWTKNPKGVQIAMNYVTWVSAILNYMNEPTMAQKEILVGISRNLKRA